MVQDVQDTREFTFGCDLDGCGMLQPKSQMVRIDHSGDVAWFCSFKHAAVYCLYKIPMPDEMILGLREILLKGE